MKYCTVCGKQLYDQDVICPGCGCPTPSARQAPANQKQNGEEEYMRSLIRAMSLKIEGYGALWLSIGIAQMIIGVFLMIIFWKDLGIFVGFFFLLQAIGLSNVIISITEFSFSKMIKTAPVGVVERYGSLSRVVFSIIINLLFGGLIGIGAEIYRLTVLRYFALANAEAFDDMEKEYKPGYHAIRTERKKYKIKSYSNI